VAFKKKGSHTKNKSNAMLKQSDTLASLAIQAKTPKNNEFEQHSQSL